MAQNDAGLVSGKIRELTRLIRKARLADSRFGEPELKVGGTQDPAPRFARKIRAHTKLESLSNALAGVYAEIPEVSPGAEDTFTFALVPGAPPRFWVDLNSFVAMTDDGRTFHFVTDTEDQRQDIFESDNLDEMANAVADYVAARIVAQSEGRQSSADRAPNELSEHSAISLQEHIKIASKPAEAAELSDTQQSSSTKHLEQVIREQVAASLAQTNAAIQDPSTIQTPGARLQQPIVIQPAPAKTDWVKLFLAFALGLFAGAMVLFAMAWIQSPPV